MRLSIGSLVLSSLLGGFVAANADTIILTDGTTFEGRVLEETATDYLLEVQVTSSIKDRRQVAKAEVASIEKTTRSETAYREILESLPLPDGASVADYDAVLDDKILPFLENQPDAAQAKEVEEIRDRLAEERNAIGGGGVRIDGHLYSADERRADAYDLDALALLRDMERKVEQGAFTAALRNFETLERDFSGSRHFREALELAQRVLPVFRRQVQAEIGLVPARLEERKIGLARLPAEERARSESLIAEEDRLYQAELAEAKGRTKWLRLSPFHIKPMEETLRTIDSEISRLERLDLTKFPDAGTAYRTAWVAASSGTPEEISTALAALKGTRLPQRYLDAVEARAKMPREEPEAEEPTEETPNEPAENDSGEADPAEEPAGGRH